MLKFVTLFIALPEIQKLHRHNTNKRYIWFFSWQHIEKKMCTETTSLGPSFNTELAEALALD